MHYKKYLGAYKRLKSQVQEHLDFNSYSEETVSRRLAINYFDSNNIEQVILKDAKRVLLTYDPVTSGIIIGIGPFVIQPNQFIYGIQPYLHVEYNLKCLVINVGTSVPFVVTGTTKDKMTGEIFGSLHGVVPNFSNGKANLGKTVNVAVKSLMATKRGPCALQCQVIARDPKKEVKTEQ